MYTAYICYNLQPDLLVHDRITYVVIIDMTELNNCDTSL